MAVELQHSVESSLAVILPMVNFLQGPSIAEITDALLPQLAVSRSSKAEDDTTVKATPPHTPLSYGQRGLWFLHQLAPQSAAYHLAGAVRIHGGLDITALHRAFEQLIDRHPALRTTFTASQSGPTQEIHEHIAPFFRYEDASAWSAEQVAEHLNAAASPLIWRMAHSCGSIC
jgi:hypothetical protein